MTVRVNCARGVLVQVDHRGLAQFWEYGVRLAVANVVGLLVCFSMSTCLCFLSLGLCPLTLPLFLLHIVGQ